MVKNNVKEYAEYLEHKRAGQIPVWENKLKMVGKYMDNITKQTTININEKANLIWSIADIIRDLYKPHEYGKVILPMIVVAEDEEEAKIIARRESEDFENARLKVSAINIMESKCILTANSGA